MQNKKFTNLTTILILASSLTLVPSLANAQSSDAQAIINAINQLSNKVEAIADAAVKTINQAAYELDKNLANTIDVNSQSNAVTTGLLNDTTDQTNSSVKNSLEQFSNAALTYSSTSQPEVKAATTDQQRQNNLKNLLTINTPASDTLYSSIRNIGSATYYTKHFMGKPPVVHDDYMNFSAIIAPDVYSSDQELASTRYIQFLTEQYKSLTDGINFQQLVNALNQYKSDPVNLGKKLDQFQNSDGYKNYQLSVRTQMAQKSVVWDAIDSIVKARTPIRKTTADPNLDAMSTVVGVTSTTQERTDPNTGEKVKYYVYASPMQIADYMATNRLNTKSWYEQMAAAPLSTLQRESVFILADIDRQLFQNHRDNERLLAALVVLSLQSAQSQALLQQTQTANINNSIAQVTGQAQQTSASQQQTTTGTTVNTQDLNSQDLNQYTTTPPPADTTTTPSTTQPTGQ